MRLQSGNPEYGSRGIRGKERAAHSTEGLRSKGVDEQQLSIVELFVMARVLSPVPLIFLATAETRYHKPFLFSKINSNLLPSRTLIEKFLD
mmetsp:Transcript_14848/g.30784  ORF Transcript_14848/g.30784 Transcript_14848/m.30784 type:complete len:91 (-) Transcript_14848:118-390(-)